MLINVEGTPKSKSDSFPDSLYELERGMPRIGSAHREIFNNAKPYPHIIFENLFDPLLLKEAFKEFPDLNEFQQGVSRFNGPTDSKLGSEYAPYSYPLPIRHLCFFFSSTGFIDFLQLITGFKENLIADPFLFGGGLHQVNQGGYLKLHTDFNTHPLTKLDRRLNVILYLNEDWDESYGGSLELWDQNMNQKTKKSYLPLINRLAIFPSNDFTFHGHPDPLECPSNISRKSLALYFYSNGRPANELKNPQPHLTVYKERPGEKFTEKTIL